MPVVHDLLGRDRELDALNTWIGALERLPATCVILGEAGIGKTSLVRAAVENAGDRGYRVLRAMPAEPESVLAYAGLGDLLGESLDEILASLPPPQQQALEVALLLREADQGTDWRALGVGLLNAIRLLASKAPVLIAVDDTQWLDAATSETVRFALRRLRSEPVAVLLARRGSLVRSRTLEADAPQPSTTIELGPMSLGAVHALVGERLGVVLSRPRLRRLHELSRGNPFHALELARAYQAGSLKLEPGEALPRDLRDLVDARLAALPAGTLSVLAACAALSRPSVALVSQAFPDLDVVEALGPAIAAGTVLVDRESIQFTHPMLASAAAATAHPADQSLLHARLAAVVPDELERVRHLALATRGADGQVAGQVEAAAEATFGRGASAEASELAALATRLTSPDAEADLERRVLLEAEYRFESGDAASAAAVLEQLAAGLPSGPRRAVVLARLARIRHFADDVAGGVALLREALLEANGEPCVQGEIEEGLAWGLLLMRSDLADAWAHARSAAALAEANGERAAIAEALAAVAVTELVHGCPPSDAMARAMELEPSTLHLRVLRHPGFALGYVLTCSDRLVEARAVYEELRVRALDRGDESAAAAILCHLGTVECLLGDLAAGAAHEDEAAELALQNGQAPTRASAWGRRALVLAWQGETDAARSLALRSIELAGGAGFDPGQPAAALARGGEHALWALGELELSLGRAPEAVRWLGPLAGALIDAGVREPGELRFLLPMIEAMANVGRIDEARSQVKWLASIAAQIERPTARATALAGEGIIDAACGNLQAAVGHLREAERIAATGPLPFEHARIRLLLGRLERRTAMKRDARASLEASLDVFATLGSTRWAENARAELGRIGGRSTGDGTLTDSERRVASLVATGLSNKEVATALFVTPKAVEASLSRIFAKRGVRSRTELVALLANETDAAGPG
jgi:DNA-binding CsgD family transcriptional regulator/tetratricopeptide (TPR) repeat protein